MYGGGGVGRYTNGRSKGGARDVRPPGSPNSLNSMQFWGKFGKIVCWRVGAPTSGNPGSATVYPPTGIPAPSGPPTPKGNWHQA